jgi:cytochrome b subunit of formate dehydrogenase
MNRKIKNIIHWSLLAFIAAYLITGLGITEYRTVEALTFGMLTKNISFQIHDFLLIPFVMFLALHIYLTVKKP